MADITEVLKDAKKQLSFDKKNKKLYSNIDPKRSTLYAERIVKWEFMIDILKQYL